jgi:hypothetical protein
MSILLSFLVIILKGLGLLYWVLLIVVSFIKILCETTGDRVPEDLMDLDAKFVYGTSVCALACLVYFNLVI